MPHGESPYKYLFHYQSSLDSCISASPKSWTLKTSSYSSWHVRCSSFCSRSITFSGAFQNLSDTPLQLNWVVLLISRLVVGGFVPLYRIFILDLRWSECSEVQWWEHNTMHEFTWSFSVTVWQFVFIPPPHAMSEIVRWSYRWSTVFACCR